MELHTPYNTPYNTPGEGFRGGGKRRGIGNKTKDKEELPYRKIPIIINNNFNFI
jgi:hypothetical protein